MGSFKDENEPPSEHGSIRPSTTSLLVMNIPQPPSLWQELSSSIRIIIPGGKKSFSVSKWIVSAIYGLFPILRWGKNYDIKSFKSDLMAGLTLASLGIPQSIGYANLAKLDPQYGLYTSFVPPLIYAVMGTSRDIAIGPVAVVSLLLSSMVQKVVDPSADPVAYRKLIFTASFFTGVFQASFGVFQLGFLVDLISHATIVGFMGGAAILIGLQQLKGLLGISHFTNNTDVVSVVKAVWFAVNHPWHPYNFVIGCSFFIIILVARFIGRKNKKLFWLSAVAPLISVVLSTLLVSLTRADKHGVKIIQHVDQGVNLSSAKQLQLAGPHVGEIAKIGLICAVIALTEAIAVGRSFASVKGYQLDGNKEMVAMGFMNIAGSLSSCYVATGSFSRTAVNVNAGNKTAVSNIVMAVTVFVALQLLMKLLYYTPITILASIILSALPGLIDLREAYNIWKVDKTDFLVCLGAFLGVLFGSVQIGLLTAITISFAKIIIRAIWPSLEKLGRIQGTEIFSSTRQYPIAVEIPSVQIICINSPFLCFTNANFIRERILRSITEECNVTTDQRKEEFESVVLDMSNVVNIDTSGISALEELHRKLSALGVQLAIANPGWHVIYKLKLAKFSDKIGVKWIFLTVGEAVDACCNSRKEDISKV